MQKITMRSRWQNKGTDYDSSRRYSVLSEVMEVGRFRGIYFCRFTNSLFSSFIEHLAVYYIYRFLFHFQCFSCSWRRMCLISKLYLRHFCFPDTLRN